MVHESSGIAMDNVKVDNRTCGQANVWQRFVCVASCNFQNQRPSLDTLVPAAIVPAAIVQAVKFPAARWHLKKQLILSTSLAAIAFSGILPQSISAQSINSAGTSSRQYDDSQRTSNSPLAQLQPISGLGKTVPRDDDQTPVPKELRHDSDGDSGQLVGISRPSKSIPAKSIGFPQETLPASKQQRARNSERPEENARDQEIIKLLKPLPIQPKRLETLTQRYSNGKIQIERQVRRDEHGNYRNDGKWKKYHTDGQLMGIGRFEDGQMVGLWKRVHFERDSAWFQTSDFQGFEFPLVSSAEFKDGQMHGMWVIKDSQERKIFELSYENGRRNGAGMWWHPNGQVRRELFCKDDLLHGLWQEWDENGERVRQNWFREGRRIAKNVAYFRENRPETEQSFLEAQLQLVEADDWWNATLGRYEPSGEATQEGPVRAWYDNGQRHMAGFFKDNAKHGEFAWWHPNGTRKLLGQYDNGLRTGVWIWWHENGIKAAEIEFDAGTPVSDLLTWDEQGVRQIEPQSVLSNDRQSTAKPPLSEDDLDLEGFDTQEDLPIPSGELELLPYDQLQPDDDDQSLEELPAANGVDVPQNVELSEDLGGEELNLDPPGSLKDTGSLDDPGSQYSTEKSATGDENAVESATTKLPPPKPN